MTVSSIQSLERVRGILASGEPLDEDRSRECFEYIFEPTYSSAESTGYLSLVGSFILQCDPFFLCHAAVRDLQFWNLLKEVLEEATPQEVVSYLDRLLLELLRRPEEYKESYVSLCQATSSDTVILEALILSSSFENLDTSTTVSVLSCVSSLFACHTHLLTFFPADAAHIIPSFIIQSLDSGLWDVLTFLLSIDDGRIEIIRKLLTYRRAMFLFLQSVTVNDYDTPLKNKLLVAFNSAINPGSECKIKFEETAEYQKLDNVNLLQALDITTFLNSKNLTFLKTFTEQLLFGSRPFPLFYACLHICDTINDQVEKIETRTTDIVHNFTFSLNKEKLIYALMDRILKSWVESHAETEEDMDSLLLLVSIIVERIEKSMPESSGLSPSEYLRLALDVIQEVDYKLSRQLQLDALREAGYERWSQQVGCFDDMLSNQVRDYVHHQRLLQLQKGTWVYAENPLDPKIKSPKVYFLVLSANQAKLLVREYAKISEKTPFTEENEIFTPSEAELGDEKSETRVITISSISSFTSEKILFNDNTPADSHLVNVIQKNVYNKVEFHNSNRKSLLVVYFDTKEAIYTWLDGLQLVCSIRHVGGLSDGTSDQIDTLIDLRKSVQMINLTESEAKPGDLDSDDEEYYDIEKLKEVTSNFYYE